jgi:Exonuclease
VAGFRGARPAPPSVSDLQGKDRNGCTISISTATGRINLSKRVGRAFRPGEVGVTNASARSVQSRSSITRNITMRLDSDPMQRVIENDSRIRDIADMGYSLEQMARSLVESGDYRVTSRLEPQTEYHLPDNNPKLVAAVVDVETTGTNPDRDSIIELGIGLFEYDRLNGRIYKVLGSSEWLEDPGLSIPPEVTKITGITDEMIAGRRVDDHAVNGLLSRVVLII